MYLWIKGAKSPEIIKKMGWGNRLVVNMIGRGDFKSAAPYAKILYVSERDSDIDHKMN